MSKAIDDYNEYLREVHGKPCSIEAKLAQLMALVIVEELKQIKQLLKDQTNDRRPASGDNSAQSVSGRVTE